MVDSMVGKRVVVTGGSLGIGAAITRGLLHAGAEVVMGCRNVARAAAVDFCGRSRLHLEAVDISSIREVADFSARIAARWSRLDVLIHNAGASFPQRRQSVDGLELTFATNVLGGYALSRALLPLLREAEGRGRIVHVGSAAQYLRPLRSRTLVEGREPYLHEWVYAHSKRGQFELSEYWAETLDAQGITSTCAHPGLVATPGVAEAFPRYHRWFGNRLPSADEGADTALWLATSPKAAGLTGGLWWQRRRQPTDLGRWTRSDPRERLQLRDMCEQRLNP